MENQKCCLSEHKAKNVLVKQFELTISGKCYIMILTFVFGKMCPFVILMAIQKGCVKQWLFFVLFCFLEIVCLLSISDPFSFMDVSWGRYKDEFFCYLYFLMAASNQCNW